MSGYPFIVSAASVDEGRIQAELAGEKSFPTSSAGQKMLVQKLAEVKAAAVIVKLSSSELQREIIRAKKEQSRLKEQDNSEEKLLLLGADTIVCLEDLILGKPKDIKEAEEMLLLLAGKTHLVHTGVALLQLSAAYEIEGRESFVSTTEVEFLPLDFALQQRIKAYAGSGEALDKAGAYGIQDQGAVFIAGIKGDYYNVMGLPLSRVVRHLDQIFNAR